MGFISFLLSQLLAAYTILVEPIVRTNFYRNLKKQVKVNPQARLLFYRTQILWEWSWIIVLIVILIPQSDPLGYIGLTLPGMIGWIILAALVFGIGLSTYLLHRNPRALESMKRSLENTSFLLPTTAREQNWYIAVAITAGICEELLYRGFLLRYLSVYFFGLGWLLSSIISGVVYGLSRVGLGRKNIIQTMLNGFSFAILYFLSGNLLSTIGSSQPVALVGSVIPSIVFHALADLRPIFLWQPVKVSKKKNK